MKTLGILLFEDFETLDVFGPVEIFGRLQDLFTIEFYSQKGGLIGNNHGVKIQTIPFVELNNSPDILLIPGGYGTRKEVDNTYLIDWIRRHSEKSEFVLTVCTGSALLAKSGLLDGKIATSNKRAFDWVSTNGEKVNWKRRSRWTVDGKYYTSAGVSAGMDMSLGFLHDVYGYELAKQLAIEIEYHWSGDLNEDPFADYYRK